MKWRSTPPDFRVTRISHASRPPTFALPTSSTVWPLAR